MQRTLDLLQTKKQMNHPPVWLMALAGIALILWLGKMAKPKSLAPKPYSKPKKFRYKWEN